MNTAATLYLYRTGEPLRAATAAELERSIDAAEHDGGAGVILVEIDGIEVPCYAMANSAPSTLDRLLRRGSWREVLAAAPRNGREGVDWRNMSQDDIARVYASAVAIGDTRTTRHASRAGFRAAMRQLRTTGTL